MAKYVAFLRGINVGGNKKVSMPVLKKALEDLGFDDVKTILNSGNVVFDVDEKSSTRLARAIGACINETFGFDSETTVRRMSQIESLVKKDPFKDIKVTPDHRLYVAFLPDGHLKPPPKELDVVSSTETELCFVLIVEKNRGTTDAMKVLDDTYGKQVTTRNWNTILKLIKA